MSGAPPDRWWGALSALCLIGLSSLLPWNVLITEVQYLVVRAHQDPTNAFLADHIVTLAANGYLAMNFVAFLVLLPCGHCFSPRTKIVAPLIGAAVIVLLQAVVALDTSLSGTRVMVAAIASSAALGALTAPLTSATYALSSFLPPLYVQAAVLGPSLAGVVTSILSLVTLWAAPPGGAAKLTPADVRASAFSYFSACAVTVLLGLGCYVALPYLEFVQHWASQSMPDEVAPLLAEEGGVLAPKASRLAYTRRILGDFPEETYGEAGVLTDDSSWHRLWKDLRGMPLIVGLAFFVTLIAFPGIVASICSIRNPAVRAPCIADPSDGRFYGDLFLPVMLLLFNLGDVLGRASARIWGTGLQRSSLAVYGILRLAIVGGIALCNVVPSRPWLLEHILWSDWWSAGLIALLGFTNGHLATTALLNAAKMAPPAARDKVGALMGFSLTTGLALGSLASMGLVSALQRH